MVNSVALSSMQWCSFGFVLIIQTNLLPGRYAKPSGCKSLQVYEAKVAHIGKIEIITDMLKNCVRSLSMLSRHGVLICWAFETCVSAKVTLITVKVHDFWQIGGHNLKWTLHPICCDSDYITQADRVTKSTSE